MIPGRVSFETLQKHVTSDDIWLVVDGKVYDVTDFAPLHPGGSAIIYDHAGEDASAVYNEVHAPSLISKTLDKSKHIGCVDPATIALLQRHAQSTERVDGVVTGARLKPDLSTILNLFDFEQVGHRCLPAKTWAYWEGAANDCITHKANRMAWEKVALRPHLLHDVARVDTSCKILGFDFDMPVFTSPFGAAKLAHSDGELSIARAAVRNGVTMCYATYASYPFSDTLKTVPKDYPLFFQLYVSKDRGKTERILKEVVAAGARAIFITIDLPVVGKREADERVRPAAEHALKVSNFQGAYNQGHGFARNGATEFDASFSWQDLAWVSQIAKVPIVLKGVQTAHDAELAMQAGCQGILISNHGGRAVDTSPPSLLVLLEMHMSCPEVFDRMEVFVDGGIRRGSDVLKAVCLGATAVGLGRPILYANTYGEEGVNHLFKVIKDELETAMQQCGLSRLQDASPAYVNTAELDHLVRKADDHPYAKKRRVERL